MFRIPRKLLVLALAVTAGGAALAAAGGDSDHETLKLVVRSGGGSETVEIDDLGDLAVGETRSYPTESGKSVLVTRDEKGLALDLDGKTIRVDDALADASEDATHHLRRIEIADGSARTFVVSDDPRAHRVIVRKSADGPEGFAFTTDVSEPLVVLGGANLLERVEKDARFQALDDVTRQTVRQILRDAASPLSWTEKPGDGEERIEVFVERRRGEPDEKP